ncbi:MAG: HAMP domain-containing histidine kinase, partial [Verrucomicrobia bacterium]|nr:HAMP domain-containing histidine kinase [Verrucomicrobiota bacterium]
DDGHKAYAKAASEKADQIARLVDELLAFSRASHGGTVAVRCETVLVRDAVAEAIQREAPDESVDLQLDIPPQLTVRADPELLVRALDNLLRNAIRYSASAGPIIIRASHAVADGGVTITVADSGPGVPEAELSKIFDAFYRVDVARARETGGTGLGLAIVKACIDSCSGTVSARNRKAGGLEVQIHLPNSPASVAK